MKLCLVFCHGIAILWMKRFVLESCILWAACTFTSFAAESMPSDALSISGRSQNSLEVAVFGDCLLYFITFLQHVCWNANAA